jgi:nucleoside-diphosphate-sugar epimerase
VTTQVPLVVVLGASGFVGSAVTATLARRPLRLRPVARRPSVVPADARAEVDVRTADLTGPGAVADAVAGADAVVHLVTHAGGWRGADEDPASERVNVGLVHDIVAALAHRRRPGPAPVVVLAGSTSQVGVPPRVPIDGTEPDRPETTYDWQKLAAEQALVAATARGEVRGVSLRLPTVYGRSRTVHVEDNGVVSAMMRRALAGEPLTLWSGGHIERDLLAVDDVADAFESAVYHADALSGRHWLLGTGRGIRLDELFRAIAAAVSARTGQPPVPVVTVPPSAHATSTDQHSMVVDASAFRAATGWSPRTSLREGLDRTAAAFVTRARQNPYRNSEVDSPNGARAR